MHQGTDLAAGAITDNVRLVVELIESQGRPPIIAINWPNRPTLCTPQNYDAAAAAAMRLLANASAAIAGLKASKRL